MAPNAGKLKLMRVVVREDFSRPRCDSLIVDIKQAVDALQGMDKARIDTHMEHVKKERKNTAKGPGSSGQVHPKFHKEKHSLQGKHGKTHAIC